MAKKATTTSKSEALSVARQRHEAIRDYLDQEPAHTNILTFLREKTGDGNELRLMKEMLKSCNPILNDDIHKKYEIAKSTVSKIAKDLDEYLRLFSATIKPLKAARKTICIPRQDGGNNIGYHFACFDDKTKKYLDGSATSRLFNILWDDFVKDRLYKRLKEEATAELSKKLEGCNDYQILGMEIGLVPVRTQQECLVKSYQKQTSYDHNRTWKPLNLKSFFESRSFYIISVDVGRGKTTFLRHLQLEFLQKTEFLPVFLEASTIEEWKLKDRNDFAVKLAKHYGLRLPENRVIDFIEKYFDHNLVFLIDGLDQIKSGGSEYEHMVDHIFQIMEHNVIIASRPSAVVNLEEENKYKFIRLKSFDQKAQTAYFKKNYDRAKELSQYSTDLIAIPMLAYMVRTLIEGGEDKNVDTRTKLYQKFIEHILMKYKHGKTKLPPGLRAQIRMTLGKIAYLALTEKETHIQKIPLSFCYEMNLLPHNLAENDSESLTKSGLVNIVVEQSGFTSKDCLYFTHQSFQEYLAAEYVSTNDSLIDHILAEKWNPKWKETIKFLTGLRGQEIIERILEERDNVIHSKLFLAAELSPETNIKQNLKREMSQKISSITDCIICGEDAKKYLFFIDRSNATKRFIDMLEDKSPDERCVALDILGEMRNQLDSKLLEKIIEKLKDDVPDVCHSALYVLGNLEEKVDDSILQQIVSKLEDSNRDTRSATSKVIGKLKDKVSDDIFLQIVSMLENKNIVICSSALLALGELEEKVDDGILQKIVSKLEDEDTDVQGQALFTFIQLKNKVDSDILQKIVSKLDSKVCCSALLALGELEEKADDGILQKIVLKLDDEDADVRWHALHALVKLKDKIGSNVVNKVVCMIGDENTEIRKRAIYTLANIKDKVDSKVLKKIYNMLDDRCPDVRIAALFAVEKLEDKVNCRVVRKVISMLEDDAPDVWDYAFHTLGYLKNKMDSRTIKKTAYMIENGYLVYGWSTSYTLEQYKDYLSNEIINNMIGILEDEEHFVRQSASDTLIKLKDRMGPTDIRKIVRIKNDSTYELLNILYNSGKLEFIMEE